MSRRVRQRAVLVVFAMGLSVLPSSGCSIFRASCNEVSYSIAISANGAATPLLAAEQWAVSDPTAPGTPLLSGWQQVSSDSTGVTLKSGDSTVHVVKLSDGTWIVDSAKVCN